MPKFRVAMESSAAIGIELEIEAADKDEAERIAERDFGGRKLWELTEKAFAVDENFIAGYRSAGGKVPVNHMIVGPDENGFEAVDVMEPEDEVPATYNHQIAIAFTVRSHAEDGSDLDSDAIKAALKERIAGLDSAGEVEWQEAILPPLESLKED